MNDEILVKHMQEDAAFQQETRQVHIEQAMFKAETEGTLADIHKKIDDLATKKDIQNLNEEMKGYLIGGNIFKYAFNNGGKLTAFLGLLVILFLIFKYGALGLVAFFASSLSGGK